MVSSPRVVDSVAAPAVGLGLDLAEQFVELAGGDLVADVLQCRFLLRRGVAELGADLLELADLGITCRSPSVNSPARIASNEASR